MENVKKENEIEAQEISDAHTATLERLEGENKTAVSKAKSARDLLESQTAEHEAKIASAKTKIKDQVRKIEDEGEAEIHDLTGRNEAKARQLRATHEKKNAELKDSLKTRLEDMKKDFAKEMAELEAEHTELKNGKMKEYSAEFSETEKTKFAKAREAIDAETEKVRELRERVARDLEDVDSQAKEIEARKLACAVDSTEITQYENDVKMRRERLVTEQALVSSEESNRKSEMSDKESLELKKQDQELDLLRVSLNNKRSAVDTERLELEAELAKITELHKNINRKQEAMDVKQLAKPVLVDVQASTTNSENTMKRLDDLENYQSDFRSKLADYLQTPTRREEDDYADGDGEDDDSIAGEIVARRHRSRRKNRSRSPSRGKSVERRLFDNDSIESDGYLKKLHNI